MSDVWFFVLSFELLSAWLTQWFYWYVVVCLVCVSVGFSSSFCLKNIKALDFLTLKQNSLYYVEMLCHMNFDCFCLAMFLSVIIKLPMFTELEVIYKSKAQKQGTLLVHE